MDLPETLRPGGDSALMIPMNNYDTYIHGGLDPGHDGNVPLIPAVEVNEVETSKNGNDLFSLSENGESSGTSMLCYPSSGMCNLLFHLLFISLDYSLPQPVGPRLFVRHNTLVTCIQTFC